MGDHLIAKVYVEKTIYHIDKPFDYLIPVWMQPTLVRGCRVLVPFGRGNRKRQGIVDAVLTKQVLPKGIKSILEQLDQTPVLNREMLDMAQFIVEYTFCPFYDAVRAILPAAMNRPVTVQYQRAPSPSAMMSPDITPWQHKLLAFVKSPKTQKQIETFLSDGDVVSNRCELQSLVQRGMIVRHESAGHRVSDKTVTMLTLSQSFLSGGLSANLTQKQQRVTEFLEQAGAVETKETLYFCAVGKSVIAALINKGVVRKLARKIDRTPTSDHLAANQGVDSIQLSAEQQRVFDGLALLLEQKKAQAALLYGVTGSGKTQVFVKLIQRVLADGRQAVMLVPEISLTPQMVARFSALFGKRVALMHSGLSLGEQLDEYKRMKQGKADIVVGTRSAVFAPFEDIGIIIMDEEGEPSYKSDSTPRYHAREIAKMRCMHHGAMLLLASATPSIESFYFAKKNKYHLFELEERYAQAQLPTVYLVDMKQEEQQFGARSLSAPLQRQLKLNLEQGHQSILFINRRGYHTIAQCIQCGQVITCSHCDVAMTYHRDNGYMMCHHCGYAVRLTDDCPACNSPRLKLSGLGTQKIEDEIQLQYPHARILRMDADTTHSRYAYEEKFAAFERGAYDILIGTQMVAKGLNFPNVTLVGVLHADAGLYAPDYRGVERVFSLITQVVGRSGRAEHTGRAYIQTYLPDHPVLAFAAKQDYHSFYLDEITARQALKYPPFCDLCTVTVAGENQVTTHQAAEKFLALMKQHAKPYQPHLSFRVLGPFQATIYKMNQKYREKILIKCRFKKLMRQYLSTCLKQAGREKEMRGITVTVDVNGDNNT